MSFGSSSALGGAIGAALLKGDAMYYNMKWTPEGLVCLGASASGVDAARLKLLQGGFITYRSH